MLLRIMSDLHLEFERFEIPSHPNDKNTVLILAGDIMPLKYTSPTGETLLTFLQECSDQFQEVLFVPGNHEFYGMVFDPNLTMLKQDIKTYELNNVHILTNNTFERDGIVFIGCTLWTDMTYNVTGLELMKYHATSAMADYNVIYAKEGQRLSPDDTINEFNRSIKYIQHVVRNPNNHNKQFVWITHHGISPKSISERYQRSSLNGAFITDLTDLIYDLEPLLVVHGHVHQAFEYNIGDTKVLVNPRGYPSENNTFNPHLTFQLNNMNNKRK